MPTELSIEIKKLREKLSLSQTRFGKKIGVNGKTICAYECARAKPSLKVYERIAEVYGVTLTEASKRKNAQIKELVAQIKAQLEQLTSLTSE